MLHRIQLHERQFILHLLQLTTYQDSLSIALKMNAVPKYLCESMLMKFHTALSGQILQCRFYWSQEFGFKVILIQVLQCPDSPPGSFVRPRVPINRLVSKVFYP